MTVHENTLTHAVEARKVLADREYNVVIRARQVLPEPVECRDAMRLKRFWVVRKANTVDDAITTTGMLTRFLQIHNDANVQV